MSKQVKSSLHSSLHFNNMMQERGSGRSCDTCRSAAATVHCRADSAYLCAACDARVHAANRVASRHERVRVCDACERAPAAFLCRADAASLCAACDADIHSANPLAGRHHRVPVTPIDKEDGSFLAREDGGEEEAASWLLLKNSGFLVDDYLDLAEYNSRADHSHHLANNQQQQQQQYCVPQNNYGCDNVVPVQPKQQLVCRR